MGIGINSTILHLVQQITEELTLLKLSHLSPKQISLRKENIAKTIQSTLSIEGNTLDLNQINNLLQGIPVSAPSKYITEAQNAIELYSNLSQFNPLNPSSLLQAHHLLMKNLIHNNGQYRTSPVAIHKGSQITHIAPPANRVPELIHNLFSFLNNDPSPWLIKAPVFHYEFEFIHPFSDGNGRIGRLWQQLLLMQHSPLFQFVPIEEIVKRHQPLYYQTLESCDHASNSTPFIEFSLQTILTALQEIPKNLPQSLSPSDRLSIAKQHFKQSSFSRKDYLSLFNLSTATASRDLLNATQSHLLLKSGDKSTSKYSFTP